MLLSFKNDADIVAAIDKAHESRGGMLEKYARQSGLDKPPRSGPPRSMSAWGLTQ